MKKSHYDKKIPWIIGIVLACGLIAATKLAVFMTPEKIQETPQVQPAQQEQVQMPLPEEQKIPDEINLTVPFTSQAPFSNWGLPYQESCEEASALMVHAFHERKTLSPDEANKQILALVNFQTTTYGFYKDTTAEEVARFVKAYWGYASVRVLPATIDAIKHELAAGLPVLVPAAGRQLGNPNFTHPGPIYHMLVIKGYTTDGRLITNDPGTRNGADYTYTQETLMNAIHDWNNGDVDHGERLMIVIDPH